MKKILHTLLIITFSAAPAMAQIQLNHSAANINQAHVNALAITDTGSGVIISASERSDIGSNTTHRSSTANPHSVTAAQVGVESGATADQVASEVPFTPDGSIAATDVQAAIQEVRDEAGSGTDANAIHDNTGSEISAVTLKGTPVSADMILIEDSADSNNKKRITVGSLPTGGGGEANTMSSGGSGASLYYQKSGVDLQLNAIKSENSLISIALDSGTHDVELTFDTTPTFTTVDTGQGANELYDMDQNVTTSSSPTFAGLALSGGSGVTISGNSTGPQLIFFNEDSDNGTNYVGWGSPAANANDIILLLPTSDPTANQVLQAGVPSSVTFSDGVARDASQLSWVANGSAGAPTDADYLVGTSNGSLSAEIVVGTTPGGELGGTWASPTIDDSVAVTGWALGASTATTPSAGDDDTSLATTAFTINEIEIQTRTESTVLAEPDQLQPISDAWLIKYFPAELYPSGVTIDALHIATSATCTDVLNFEEWTQSGTAASSTVESITLSGTFTEDDGTLADASIAADGRLMVDLPATPTDIAFMEITVVYHAN